MFAFLVVVCSKRRVTDDNGATTHSRTPRNTAKRQRILFKAAKRFSPRRQTGVREKRSTARAHGGSEEKKKKK